MSRTIWRRYFGALLLCLWALIAPPRVAAEEQRPITLRLWTIPDTFSASPMDAARARVIELFRQRHPQVLLKKTAGIQIPQIGASAALLMAIAGGVAPDVLEAPHESLHRFVEQGFLLPLDEYIAGVPEEELYARAPRQVWDAARLRGPDGKLHLYAIPSTYAVSALKVRHDVLAQLGHGPEAWPRTWEQLYALAQEVTAGSRSRGFGLPRGAYLAEVYETLLIGAGGQPWRRDEQGRLWAAFDDEPAVQAMDLLWKLAVAPWQRGEERFEGVSYSDVDMWYAFKRERYLMAFSSVRDGALLQAADLPRFRLLPVPAAPTGTARPRLTATYAGLYAGQRDPAVRQAAFDFIMLQASDQGRRVRTQTLVELEAGAAADPLDLERFGYHSELAKLPEGYLEFYRRSRAEGYLPPAGLGADELRRALLKPVQVLLADTSLGELSDQARRERMRAVLQEAVQTANGRLHRALPQAQQRRRDWAALAVAGAVFVAFGAQLWLVQRAYAPKLAPVPVSRRGARRPLLTRLNIALALAPALLLILMWEYYPLLRGTVIAFQDYRFLEGSQWVGLENFSRVLFSEAFWLAMARTAQYTVLALGLGFVTPVLLALLLHELPRGSVLFRLLYYLPALTTGIVVVFLWKSFYDPGPNGLLNYLLSFARLAPRKWLDDPSLAMLCCVMPTVWAGLGVGCLIYLAALKSIPTELYEAAAIDGCSVFGRLRHIALPYLRPLMIINFVGVLIGTFHSAGYILVLTGGGPNDATNVVSLEIFYEAYARLALGSATAMSWMLALALIGFTLFQIRYLARLEFRTAGANA